MDFTAIVAELFCKICYNNGLSYYRTKLLRGGCSLNVQNKVNSSLCYPCNTHSVCICGMCTGCACETRRNYSARNHNTCKTDNTTTGDHYPACGHYTAGSHYPACGHHATGSTHCPGGSNQDILPGCNLCQCRLWFFLPVSQLHDLFKTEGDIQCP